jgi:hypothetical protein
MKTLHSKYVLFVFAFSTIAYGFAAPAPSYFTATAAGWVPPLANPIALKQCLDGVTAVAYDANGNLYYSDGAQVWRLNADGSDTLIAGIPAASATTVAGDGGSALQASIPAITGLGFDSAGNLYIAESAPLGSPQVIRKVTPQQLSPPLLRLTRESTSG